MKKKGFTLLELLIVVVILAILAGLALPQYLRTIKRAREAEGLQSLGVARSALMRYYAEWEDLSVVTFVSGELDITDINASPDRLFNYAFVDNLLGAFTITATPQATCGGCRTIEITETGDITYL